METKNIIQIRCKLSELDNNNDFLLHPAMMRNQ